MADALPSGSHRGDARGRSALVVGATGLVGGRLVALLAGDPWYERVVAVGRRPLDSAPANVDELIVDFDALDHHAGDLVADHVYCALGTTRRDAGSRDAFRRVDLHYPHRIARVAREHGARHFSLVSAIGADPTSRIFYSRVKGEAEAAVREVEYPGGAIFRPSMLGGHHEGRPAERIGQVIAGWLPRRWKTVDAGDVARAMVRVAKEERQGWRVIENAEIFDRAGEYAAGASPAARSDFDSGLPRP